MQADKKQVNRLLNTAKGQIEGILKMVEDDRYCVSIAHQIMSAQAVLKRANKEVLAAHLKHCVIDAIDSDVREQRIEEMIDIIDELIK